MDAAQSIPEPSARSPRFAAVELLRITGCVGICMFHAHAPWPRHISPGSEVFMAVTIAFATRAAGKIGFVPLVKKRFMSLVVTWLIWCLIYAVFESLRTRDGQPWHAWFESWHQLLAGSIWELWFPPFAFAATVLIAAWLTFTKWKWKESSLVLALIAGVLLILCSSLHGNWLVEEDQPYHEWLRMLPAAVFGAAIARLPQGAPSSARGAVGVGVIMLASALVSTLMGWGEIPSRYYATIVLVCTAWCIPVVAPRWLLLISQLTFGVYLVHMGFIVAYYKFMPTFSLPDDPWAMGVIITLASFAAVPFLRYTPLRWMVGVWRDRGQGLSRD